MVLTSMEECRQRVGGARRLVWRRGVRRGGSWHGGGGEIWQADSMEEKQLRITLTNPRFAINRVKVSRGGAS